MKEHEKIVDSIMNEYELEKYPIFRNDSWEYFTELKNINIKRSNKSLKYHDIVLSNNQWNDMKLSPLSMNGRKQSMEVIETDYRTIKSIQNKYMTKEDNYLRKLASFGNVSVCTNIGVTSIVTSKEDTNRFLYIKRSDKVGVYPNKFSIAPSGSLEPHHKTLKDCAVQELDEEIIGGSNLDNYGAEMYYTGAFIDPIFLSLGISSIIIFEDYTVSEIKDKAQTNFEIEELYVGEFDNINELNMYNTTPSLLYSTRRAKRFLNQLDVNRNF